MFEIFGNPESGDSPENKESTTEVKQEESSDFENDFDKKWSEDDSDPPDEGKTDENGVRYVKCTLEKLEGQTHPKTGVPYERKTVEVNGEKIEGVFPQFKSEYNTKIPEDMYKENDNKQMKYCTEQLREEIKNNPELAEKFDERQLAQIERGYPRIDGYTWHHSENPGEMQLVDSDIHDQTKHTGGRSIWGGGKECR